MFTSQSSRRHAVATCLGLFLALVPANTSFAQDVPVLRLALFDTVGLAANVTAETRHRVEDTFEQIGVVIEWYEPSSVSEADDAAAPYYLKVILFDREAAAMGHPADAMGISFHTDLLPDTVWLFDPVIRRVLEGSSRRRRPLNSLELGRAYGRVLAHEVIHAVANDMRHADSGIMAPTQNRKLLLVPSTALDQDSAQAFLQGMARIQQLLVARR